MRLLVFGGASLVGRHVCRLLGPERTVPTFHRRPCPGGQPFELGRHGLEDLRLDDARAALLLFGETFLDTCAKDPEGTRRINVQAMGHLVEELWERDILPVYFSTDTVFEGSRGLYREEDPPRPIIEYSRQKLEVEQFLQGREHLIVRLSKVYSLDPQDGTILTDLARRIREGREVVSARDQVFSPVFVEDLVRALDTLLTRGARGLYHLGGPEPWSRSQLYHRVLEALRSRGEEVVPHHQERSLDDFGLLEVRPKNTSLDSSRLWALVGGAPLRIEEAVARL